MTLPQLTVNLKNNTMKPDTILILKLARKYASFEIAGGDFTPRQIHAALDDAIATLEQLEKVAPQMTIADLEEIMICPH